MINTLRTIRMFLWMSLVTGIFYPLILTLIAQTTVPKKANGSIVSIKNKVVGSSLIAQKFEQPKYFWPRPSASDYNTLAPGGSNLGPTSAELKKAVGERSKKVSAESGIRKIYLIPSELLYASASGLDPHISPETAYFQIERIVKARNNASITLETLRKMIDDKIQHRFLGFIGQPYVNVLELNLALDEMK